MRLKILFSSILLVYQYVSTADTNSYMDYKKLYDYLEKRMDTRIRPVLNKSDVLNVFVMPSLVSIQGLDEKAQVLRSTLVLLLDWSYETLQWSPSQYGNTSIIHFSPDDIWLPDLAYQNAVGETFELKRLKTMKVAVTADGHAAWPNGANLETICHVDITKYPFDSQVCKILVGKVYSFDNEIMLIPKSHKVDITAHTDNDEWELTDSKVHYKKLFEQMTFIELELILQRRSLFYVLNTISPVVLLSLLNVFSFKLPITSGERMSYCISLFLTFIVLLNMISDSMPEVSKTVSYLQLYVNIQLISSMVTTTLSIFLVKMAQDENYIPTWMIMLKHKVTQCKARNKVKADSLQHLQVTDVGDEAKCPQKGEMPIKQEVMSESEEKVDKITWVKFIDNLCFWIFFGLFLVTTFVGTFLMLT